MFPQLDHSVKAGLDAISLSIVAGTLLDILPVISVLVPIAYYGLLIFFMIKDRWSKK